MVIDIQLVGMAVEAMHPQAREVAERKASARGVSVGDLILEECLEDIQGQLYALRHRKQPTLEVVEGGRA